MCSLHNYFMCNIYIYIHTYMHTHIYMQIQQEFEKSNLSSFYVLVD